MSTSSAPPWHAAFPTATMTADIFPQRRALMVLSMKIASMLIVDVRREDYAGGAIRGSLNVPAQGFYWNRGMLYELAYKSDMEWIVFTCGSCKEDSRGARCAAWFLDHVRNTVGDKDMQVCVLEGGIKGWVRGGKQYTEFMDGFDQAYWDNMRGNAEPAEDKQVNTVQSPSATTATPNASVGQSEPPKKEKVWSYESMME